MKKPKVLNGIMYAYYSPDGYIQVRSIGTKRESRDNIPMVGGGKTYKDYEEAGFRLLKINASITPII